MIPFKWFNNLNLFAAMIFLSGGLASCGGNPYKCLSENSPRDAHGSVIPCRERTISPQRETPQSQKEKQKTEQTVPKNADVSDVKPDERMPLSQPSMSTSITPLLETRGNKIYTASGEIFRGRGANIHETRSCNACTWSQPDVNEVKRRIDALVDDWNANFIRLLAESYPQPKGRVHYADILHDAGYLRDLIEIVTYIGTKPDTYVMVSLWTDTTTDKNGWPTAETIPVWKVLSEALVNQPHVMFGIINEPHGNWNGKNDAVIWKAMNNVVKGIRAVEKKHSAPRHIIAVQGTRKYARHIGYYVDHPITAGNGENIVYEIHAYMTPDKFEEFWIKPSRKIPLVIGEFGPFDLGNGFEMTIEDSLKLIDEAEKRDIPWLAWTFHMRCEPNLLVDNSGGGCGANMDLTPTNWGKAIKNRLSTDWISQ